MNLIYLLGGAVIATFLNKKKSTSGVSQSMYDASQQSLDELQSETLSLQEYITQIENEILNNTSLNSELVTQLEDMLETANLDISELTSNLTSAVSNDALTPYSQDNIDSLNNLVAEADLLRVQAENALNEATQLNSALNAENQALSNNQDDGLTPYGQSDLDDLELEYNTSLDNKQSELDIALNNQDDGLTPFGQADIDSLQLSYENDLETKNDEINALMQNETTLQNYLEESVSTNLSQAAEIEYLAQELADKQELLDTANANLFQASTALVSESLALEEAEEDYDNLFYGNPETGVFGVSDLIESVAYLENEVFELETEKLILQEDIDNLNLQLNSLNDNSDMGGF